MTLSAGAAIWRELRHGLRGRASLFFIGVASPPTTRFRLAGGCAETDYWCNHGHLQYRLAGKTRRNPPVLPAAAGWAIK
jgi:hypothetical protein